MQLNSDTAEDPRRPEENCGVEELQGSKDCARGKNGKILKAPVFRNKKSILLAQASHEIKTPLASILGYTDSLLNHGHLNDEDKKDVIGIKRQSQYMSELVRDLIDIARLDGHQFPLQPIEVNPVQLIDDVIQAARVRYKERHIVLHVEFPKELPRRLKIDPTRFHQALSQVLSNAYNYTFEGQIDVRIDYCRDPLSQGGHLNIQIEDSGIGMSEKTQKRIFNAFMRGDYPEVQQTHGTGLGLTLARSLMRAMNGYLHLLDSNIGVGSLFEIGLHLQKVNSPSVSVNILRQEKLSSELLAAAIELTGRKILVVDDSDDLRVLMHRCLNKAGATVETSENGADAVSKALHEKFDCILMDIRMPVMNGYEATQLLRESGYDRPIIALTAQACEEDQKTSAEMGFTAYLSKPVDLGHLKELLRNS